MLVLNNGRRLTGDDVRDQLKELRELPDIGIV
jgi:hypothetical protein